MKQLLVVHPGGLTWHKCVGGGGGEPPEATLRNTWKKGGYKSPSAIGGGTCGGRAKLAAAPGSPGAGYLPPHGAREASESGGAARSSG